jgi:hypothetical protein
MGLRKENPRVFWGWVALWGVILMFSVATFYVAVKIGDCNRSDLGARTSEVE